MRFVDVARNVGLDPYPILRQAAIDPNCVEDPDSWVLAESVKKVLEETVRLSGRDDIAVLLADRHRTATIGPVGLLLEHERTAREIIISAIEFMPLLADFLVVTLEERDGMAFISFQTGPDDVTTLLPSLIVAIAHKVLGEAVQEQWSPIEVQFRCRRPRYLQTYSKFFGCPLVFGGSFDGFVCTSGALDQLSKSADAMLVGLAKRLLYLTPEMSEGERVDFAEKVKAALYLSLRHGTPTLKRVASGLGMSKRSVQRKLASEGRSFEKLLSEVRSALARSYLEGPIASMAEVAPLIGFSSGSAFSRWFRKEFGVPPSRWSKEAKHRSAVAVRSKQ